MIRRSVRRLAPLIMVAAFAGCAMAPPARAFDPTKPICTLAGLVSTLAGKVCSTARHAGSALKAGQKLLGGHLGGALETLAGASPKVKALTATAALAAAGAWVTGGARTVLRETASVVSQTTRPELQSTWFSAFYWRMAAISALLTLPFLFAAAVQAILRSDLALLARSAFGYLPLGLLGVSIAAPLIQLLLAASDELSSLVSSASGYTEAGFAHVTGLAIATGGFAAFPLFFIALLTVAATMTLWLELLLRSAAVYVIVLMLPLFFAALVWPARRIWAVRAVEVLIALILSKFAIVAVLALGSAALGHTSLPSVTQMLAGTALVMLAAFAPWALLRLLPLHELASGVEGLRTGPAGTLAASGAQAQAAQARVAEEHRAPPPEGLGPVGAEAPGAARIVLENLDGQQPAGVSPRPEESEEAQETSEPAPAAGVGALNGDTAEPAAGQPWAPGMEAPFLGSDLVERGVVLGPEGLGPDGLESERPAEPPTVPPTVPPTEGVEYLAPRIGEQDAPPPIEPPSDQLPPAAPHDQPPPEAPST